MNRVTRVLLVRHGETIWNKEGRIQGHLDSELTARGVAQAESVAARLRGKALDAIYSSDLGRAYKTAERIADVTGCPITVERRLRERNLGIFQGLVEDEIRERFPDEWGKFLNRNPDYRIPGGESARDRVLRAESLLDEVANLYSGKTVLFVTHGGILDGVFRLVTGLPLDAPRKFKIWNAGINLISRSEDAGPSAADTGSPAAGGPPSATGRGWMIELWGDTGSIPSNEGLVDT
jgi:probable phosphoglycerate mutase